MICILALSTKAFERCVNSEPKRYNVDLNQQPNIRPNLMVNNLICIQVMPCVYKVPLCASLMTNNGAIGGWRKKPNKTVNTMRMGYLISHRTARRQKIDLSYIVYVK